MRPDDIPQEVWGHAVGLWRDDELDDGPTIIARAILAERERLWAYLESAPGAAIDAMAAGRAAGSNRNGHGNHSYRDEWLAGVRAIRGAT